MKTNKHRSQKMELAEKLSWEDDGGKIGEVRTLLSGRHFVLPMQINIGTFPTPLEWNDKFSIELYRPRTAKALPEQTP